MARNGEPSLSQIIGNPRMNLTGAIETITTDNALEDQFPPKHDVSEDVSTDTSTADDNFTDDSTKASDIFTPKPKPSAVNRLSRPEMKQLLRDIVTSFPNKRTAEMDLLEILFEYLRTETDFFHHPQVVHVKNKLDEHLSLYKKEFCLRAQNSAARKRGLETSEIPVKEPLKLLGGKPVEKLQKLIIDRLSGEDKPVPINNLLQSLSAEYLIPKSVYCKKWKKFLEKQDFLVLNESQVSVAAKYNSGASKNLKYPIKRTDLRSRSNKRRKYHHNPRNHAHVLSVPPWAARDPNYGYGPGQFFHHQPKPVPQKTRIPAWAPREVDLI